MSELKATPGPWECDFQDHDARYQDVKIRPSGRKYHAICKVWMDDAPVPEFNAEQKGNAHLIAAAPEMYELLEMVFLSIEGGGRVVTFSDDDYEEMRAALAKARGEA